MGMKQIDHVVTAGGACGDGWVKHRDPRHRRPITLPWATFDQNRRGKSRCSPAVTTNQDDFRERSKGTRQAELKAGSRGRDAAFADRHDHCGSDEGNRLAAALRPRLLRWRGAKEASIQTQLEEDRR